VAVLRWLRYLLIGLLIGASLLVFGSVLWAAVVEPSWLVPNAPGLAAADRVRALTDFRTTAVTLLGGIAVAAGAVVAALNFRETSRQNRAVLELQRRGQVTERFTRAIEQLGQRGDEKLDVRIGAIYALEQIAQDSAELHWPIIEVLTAYLREHAAVSADRQPAAGPAPEAAGPPDGSPPIPADPTVRPSADQQAIATVIGRRRTERDPDGQHLNLSGVSLPGVNWARAHLERANLGGAHLEEANLREAHLEHADLEETHLEGAWLEEAHLERAHLRETHLEEAFLLGAHLERAELFGTHLEGAFLLGVRLLETTGLSPALVASHQAALSAEAGGDPRQPPAEV
jgi:hypothetical protein